MIKTFRGPWAQGRPTSGHIADVIVSTTNSMLTGSPGMGPEDIFVGAGCQRGNLHITTVIDLIDALIEAVVERGIPSPRWSISVYRRDATPGAEPAARFEITGNGRIETFRTKTGDGMWSIYDGDTLISGPHDNSRFSFRFTVVPQDERIRDWITRLTPSEGR